MKKSLFFATLFSSCLLAEEVTWTLDHEKTVQESLTKIATALPKQTVLVGRTSALETRIAVVINSDGHLLAPLIPAIDQSDAPYLLYRPDGSRVSLETVKGQDRFAQLFEQEITDEVAKQPARH